MRVLTTSPMLTMPASRPSSRTGTCRTRFWVINTTRWSTVSRGVQVARTVVMISETGWPSRPPPRLCSSRTTSRSDTMPAKPSGPTTTMAPMFSAERLANNWDTVVSGAMVATAAPLLLSTSAIRIARLRS